MKGLCCVVGLLVSFQANALNKMYLNNSGHITASIRWENTKLISNIKFRPDEKTLPPCQNIGFIQIEKLIKTKNKYFLEKSQTNHSDKNNIKTKNDFAIDYNDQNCKPGEKCSPFYIEHFSNNCQYGRNTFTDKFDSCIRNEKYHEKNIKKMIYETCAVCKESSKIYSCIKWEAIHEKNSNSITYIELNETPSEDFNESLLNFNNLYKN